MHVALHTTNSRIRQIVIGLILAALASTAIILRPQVAEAETIRYGRGTFEISSSIVIPDGWTLVGAGMGETIIKAAPGFTGTLIKSEGTTDSINEGRHHPDIKIRDLTVDGNGTAQRGIHVMAVDRLVVENVEAKNTTGNAIQHRGVLKTDFTNHQTWNNVIAHDCGGWGIFNGLRTRKANYNNIQVYRCTNGFEIGGSEGQANNVTVTDNKVDGFWLRNVYGMNLSNIRATGNGRYGMHVQGLVSSVSSKWQAMNNGKIDIWFNQATPPDFNYGVTRQTIVSGLQAGKIPMKLGAYDNATNRRSLVIDPNVVVQITDKQLFN